MIAEAINLNIVRHAIEQLNPPSGIFGRYRVFSRQNGDLLWLVGIYTLIFVAAIFILVVEWPKIASGPLPRDGSTSSSAANNSVLSVIFGSAIFGAYVAVIARLIESAQKRLGAVDLFVSEVLSIGRVFVSVQIIPNFAKLLRNTAFLRGFADVARGENYTAIFERNSGDLGTLTSETINNVTAFYSFLKASRDATQSLKLWSNRDYPDQQKKEDVISIVLCCFFMAIHGRIALESLIERRAEARLAYAREIFHTVELQAFLVLSAALIPEDPRIKALEVRAQYYLDLLAKHGLGGALNLAKSLYKKK